MASATAIRVFELEPDLIRVLPAEERAEAVAVELPVRALAKGVVDVRQLFARTGSFATSVRSMSSSVQAPRC
jgi:hypothetical protein